jgi:hypothetical protein
VEWSAEDPAGTYADIECRTQAVEWLQFRLNEDETDIEVLQSIKQFRQKGYEVAEDVCDHPGARHINQVFVPAIPFNGECTEWVDLCYYGKRGRERRFGTMAPVKHRFNPQTGLYEWVETGPPISDEKKILFEGSVVRVGNEFLIAPRVASREPSYHAWVRTPDPFAPGADVCFTPAGSGVPVTAYRCADGVPRLFTGDARISPYGQGRNPMYCWDINVDDFSLANRHVVFDPVIAKILPGEIPQNLCVDFCKCLPHPGGKEQTLVFRVKTFNLNHQRGRTKPMTEAQMGVCGVHYATVHYREDHPPTWEF